MSIHKTNVAGLVAVGIGVFAVGAAGSAPGRTARPSLPYLDWGACPFECCVYGGWVATNSVVVQAEPRDKSPVIFKLDPGDSVVGLTGVVVTRKLGTAVAVRAGELGEERVQVAIGDSVAVLHAEGEGYWKVWLSGRMDSGGVADTSAIAGDPEFLLRMTRYPEGVWWARVKDMRGRSGWVREPYGFRHIDSCE